MHQLQSISCSEHHHLFWGQSTVCTSFSPRFVLRLDSVLYVASNWTKIQCMYYAHSLPTEYMNMLTPNFMWIGPKDTEKTWTSNTAKGARRNSTSWGAPNLIMICRARYVIIAHQTLSWQTLMLEYSIFWLEFVSSICAHVLCNLCQFRVCDFNLHFGFIILCMLTVPS